MRLSRAVLVMLLLHVIAVGGILAFSLIKEHGRSRSTTSPTTNAVEAEDSDLPPAKVESQEGDRPAVDNGGTLAEAGGKHSGNVLTRISNDPNNSGNPSNAANDAAERIAGGHTSSVVSPAPANSAGANKNGHLPADSGKTYVVRKGESPYTIAEKLKVDAAALLKLNGIDDPKKLKPGQTLRVPAANHGKAK